LLGVLLLLPKYCAVISRNNVYPSEDARNPVRVRDLIVGIIVGLIPLVNILVSIILIVIFIISYDDLWRNVKVLDRPLFKRNKKVELKK
jgi:hypothetical protein